MAGISSIIDQIRELILFPVKIPELYKSLGVTPPSGILINGPTGCGKTSLAMAIAGELGLPFFKVPIGFISSSMIYFGLDLEHAS
jgi:ribosome biogenesis ATPase